MADANAQPLSGSDESTVETTEAPKKTTKGKGKSKAPKKVSGPKVEKTGSFRIIRR